MNDSVLLPYLNRDLSWLNFNARVLHEALDARVPLLERLKFLSIFSTNLDEFYMVRIAGLRRRVVAGGKQFASDTLTPPEQLAAIHVRVLELLDLRRRALREQLLPALAARGVGFLTIADLSKAELATVDQVFESQVFPVLTPLAVDPGHPFPYISNLSLSLAVEVRDPLSGKVHFARVKVPRSLSRWVRTGRDNFVLPLEELIGANLGALFPGMDVTRWYTFRLTRYSDLDLGQIDQPEDLLESIEEQVFQRRFGEVVRVELQRGMPDTMRELLLEEMGQSDTQLVAPLTSQDVHDTDDLLELGDLMALASLEIPDLRDPPHTALVPAQLRDAGSNIFDVIRERDLLVHHPYQSFVATVEQFLHAAAYDPQVLAIKLTLYRTGGEPAIMQALTDAAEQGKQVAVLIELQARFDEENNINFARTMESFGIHVAYGLPGLKTHAKTALVVRKDADGIRRYVHIGTGNYNSRNAKIYTDLGLFTCNPLIGADISDLFNSLTGLSRMRSYRKLQVAPVALRSSTLEMIAREADHARMGQGGRIIAKMNALVDYEVIEALYLASQAGVEIDLIVRGICCLLPGVPGLSERIRVISIIGRFLEHSRIVYVRNAGTPQFYIGSADWMPRNFDRRVEVMVPIEDLSLQPKLMSVLETCLSDNRQAWDLDAEGVYHQRQPGAEPARGTQQVLTKNPWGFVGEAGLRATGQFAAVPKPKRKRTRGRS